MKFTVTGLTLLAVLACGPAQAHDAWIELSPPGAKGQLQTFIGHAEDSAHYNPRLAHIARLYSVSAAGIDDHLALYEANIGQDVIPLEVGDNAQDALVVLSTFRARSELDAEKFNDYVAEEGIAPIANYRELQGQTNLRGREVYSRHMKAIRLGTSSGCEMGFLSEPAGETLEILPMSHPRADCGSELSFELRYFGKPVSGAVLHLNQTDMAREPVKLMTDENGRAVFERPEAGHWYVHAAWSRPVEPETYDAEFATNFASLSFHLD